MISLKKTSILASLIAVLCVPSANAVSTTGTITARVIDAVSVFSLTPLIFGYIEPGSQSGVVTITTNGSRKTSGKVKLLPGLFEEALFLVRGTPNRSYTIHTPSSLTFKGKDWLPFPQPRGKTNELTVKDFTTRSKTVGRDGSAGKFNRAGIDQVSLGGTLVVPANVAPGLYSGFVPLTVSY